jgi:hypothetical protein
MLHGVTPPLSEWETFYVILGSSAAALTGLQFVVVALGAEVRVGGEPEMRAFATPTIVHFCAVLLIAAILSTPGQTPASLSVCLTLSGLAGLGYAGWVLFLARRQTGYAPVLEDWLWHTVVPTIAYSCLFVAGIVVRWRPLLALYIVAVTALFLLYDGIHNAWDAALYMAVKRKEDAAVTTGDAMTNPPKTTGASAP